MTFASRLMNALALVLMTVSTYAQTELASARNLVTEQKTSQKVIVVTGARFSYKLVERWIDEYNKVNPNVQIIVESRGSADPQKFDILAEVFPPDDQALQEREYINVGRYAVLPVAKSSSGFARLYGNQGLDRNAIKQVFFHDIFSEKSKQKNLKASYSVYTRLQKAGVPTVFSNYFGFEQKDIKGNAIAGSDLHLLKATLRDSAGVTYLPLPLIYNPETGKPIDDLTVIPVDLNGNGKVSDDEKFYGDLNTVLSKLESVEAKDINNIPVEYLHLSVSKRQPDTEAVAFLQWVLENGQASLHEFGFMTPEAEKVQRDKFTEFASKRKQ